MSEVKMGISMDSLRKLPAGAVYTAQSGQAKVKVSHSQATDGESETVYVYGTCDSLELECERYEKTIKSLKQQTTLAQKTDTIEKKTGNAIITSAEWFSIGVISGLILMVLINRKNK